MPAQSAVPLYETFDAYDRFVNWERRLAFELPFIERQLSAVEMRPHSLSLRVLDVACGTGKHAIALAQRGYDVTGVDLSAAMIDRARANVAEAAVEGVRFAVAGFGMLAERTEGDFDALVCLGNSLPHVLTEQDLHKTLEDMASVLHPGGLLFIQTRNMDAVIERRARWMPLQARREETQAQGEGREWLFVRFYDFNPDGSLTFNVVTCEREGRGDWHERVDTTRLYPWRSDELVEALTRAGFEQVQCYGNMAGAPYDRQSSGDIVLTARRSITRSDRTSL
jgi:glycine/sarcosine N-methyltransferase